MAPHTPHSTDHDAGVTALATRAGWCSGDDPSGDDGYVPVRWGHQVDLARIARLFSPPQARIFFEAFDCKSHGKSIITIFFTDFTPKPPSTNVPICITSHMTHGRISQSYTPWPHNIMTHHWAHHSSCRKMQSKARLCRQRHWPPARHAAGPFHRKELNRRRRWQRGQ